MNENEPVSVISRSPLFLGLSAEEKEKIAALAESCTFEREEVIIAEGERCDALYLVASGTVEVIRGYRTDRETRVTSLTADASSGGYAGDFFGETCLVDIAPRSATVMAAGPVTVLRIPVRRLWDSLKPHPEVQVVILTNLARFLAHRLRETTERWAI